MLYYERPWEMREFLSSSNFLMAALATFLSSLQSGHRSISTWLIQLSKWPSLNALFLLFWLSTPSALWLDALLCFSGDTYAYWRMMSWLVFVLLIKWV